MYVIFVGNKPETKPIPKSERGIRTVPIPNQAVSFLKNYVHSKESYLFSCNTGGLMTKSSYDKMWYWKFIHTL